MVDDQPKFDIHRETAARSLRHCLESRPPRLLYNKYHIAYEEAKLAGGIPSIPSASTETRRASQRRKLRQISWSMFEEIDMIKTGESKSAGLNLIVWN